MNLRGWRTSRLTRGPRLESWTFLRLGLHVALVLESWTFSCLGPHVALVLESWTFLRLGPHAALVVESWMLSRLGPHVAFVLEFWTFLRLGPHVALVLKTWSVWVHVLKFSRCRALLFTYLHLALEIVYISSKSQWQKLATEVV